MKPRNLELARVITLVTCRNACLFGRNTRSFAVPFLKKHSIFCCPFFGRNTRSFAVPFLEETLNLLLFLFWKKHSIFRCPFRFTVVISVCGAYCILNAGPRRVGAAELNQTNRAIDAVLAMIVHTKMSRWGNSIGNFRYCAIAA